MKPNKISKQTHGSGILHDIFVKPFRPSKKVKTLNSEEALYAQIARASYERSDSPDTIEGYTKDKSFSQINSVVYTNPTTVILGIRGTNLKNPQDLLTDVNLAFNNLKTTTRYREISKRFKEILNKYTYLGKSLVPYKYIIVGHSLGSSLALQLLFDNPDTITSIYLFNPGSSPADVKKGLQMKLGKFMGVGYYKNISKKINIYRVNGDIISFASRFLNGNYTQVQSDSFDRHTMNNFKGSDNPSKAIIKPEELQTQDDIKEVEPIITASGMRSKVKKSFDIDDMSLQEMRVYIRNDKTIKNSLSGYSKLNKLQTKIALRKYLDEGITVKRGSKKKM